ncbi:MAG: carbohydrate ABC transporter permease [Anaerolineae bacterium]
MSSLNARLLPQKKRKNNVINDSRMREKYLFALLFIAPGMLLFFMFLLLPLSNSFYYSFFDWNGFGVPTDFIGIGNYERLWDHSVFWSSVTNSLIIVMLSVVVQLPLALALALIVGRGELPGRSIFRTILFIPFVFAEILTAFIWIYVFHPTDGVANLLVQTVIPGAENVLWLADPNIIIYSLFIVITWKFFGLHMILYMAALQGVRGDLEDAARLDGASELQVIRKITVPLIGPTIRLTIYLSVLGSFQQFVLFWILTRGGGPGNLAHVMSTYMYKFGILGLRLGFGSAVAVVLFVITFSFSLIYQLTVLQQDYSTE